MQEVKPYCAANGINPMCDGDAVFYEQIPDDVVGGHRWIPGSDGGTHKLMSKVNTGVDVRLQ